MDIPRQLAVWSHVEIVSDVARQRYKKRPKRSEKRQRTARITIRLLPSERATLIATAQTLGISVPELLRQATLGYIDAFEHAVKTHREQNT